MLYLYIMLYLNKISNLYYFNISKYFYSEGV